MHRFFTNASFKRAQIWVTGTKVLIKCAKFDTLGVKGDRLVSKETLRPDLATSPALKNSSLVTNSHPSPLVLDNTL